MREALASPHVDSRRGGDLPLELHRALGDPRLQARVSDLEFADAVLVLAADPVNDAPILDLRLRKGVRRRGLKLGLAMPATSSLEPSAALSVRFGPGAGAAFAAALAAALAESPDAPRSTGSRRSPGRIRPRCPGWPRCCAARASSRAPAARS